MIGRGTGTALLPLAAICLLTTYGCTKKDEAAAPAATPAASAPAAPAAAAPVAAAAAPAAAGAIKGTVKLLGKPPEMKMLMRDGDPFCARKQMKEEDVIAGAGGVLQNVLVRITSPVSGSYAPPATPATIDQSECMYRPRVQGIMAGQPLLIRNSDQTLHNVHTYKGASTMFNQAQIPGMAPVSKRFNEPGDIIKFKCDVHPWMTGYVGVSNHPFFAVTGSDGSFVIDKIPAGKYTLEAWHERLGTTSTEVTVTPNQATIVEFTIAAK